MAIATDYDDNALMIGLHLKLYLMSRRVKLPPNGDDRFIVTGLFTERIHRAEENNSFEKPSKSDNRLRDSVLRPVKRSRLREVVWRNL